MFENIGEKIKTLAKVVSIMGIAASVIYGIILMSAGGIGFIYGLLVIAVGIIISWISSFFTYGFGELLINTKEIKESVKNIASNNTDFHNSLNNNKTDVNMNRKETSVAVENIEISCPHCKAGLSYTNEFVKGKMKIVCPLCKNEIDLNK